MRHAAILRHPALHLLSHHAFIGERVDEAGVADLPAPDLGADGGDLAGDITSGDPRHRDRQTGHAAAYENIEIIQPARLDADQQIARADFRIRKIAIDDVLDAALLL